MDLAALAEYLSGRRVNNDIAVASATLQGYDYLLTLQDEVDFVWFAQWNAGKILFYLNRYLPFMDIPVHLYMFFSTNSAADRCMWLDDWINGSYVVAIILSDTILVMRTWVLWGATPIGALLLFPALAGTAIACAVLVSQFARTVQYETAPSTIIEGCFILHASEVLADVWAICLGIELSVLAITMLRGIRHRFGMHCRGTLGTLYWDAIKFASLMSAISVASLAITYTAPASYMNGTASFQRSLHSILASHVLLRLRRKISEIPPEVSTSQGTSFWVDSMAGYQISSNAAPEG
ncbi:hypothetical protein CALVIDRAFT_57756 [Calocera viscosa TUFC12733]|uniref:DUF6533 domain-containing protein n=1 Tax=Calocera viscosa (strain TUFC12733) TaxID=1330018 RepID=A0A167NGQ4_CALVF|nr:hypothetical protein CALVIDRAFT_57756 [Calocera viscosa TUFC12733]